MGNTVGMDRQRPVVVVEEQESRRRDLAAALRDRRMDPLTPRTPLEVVDLLARSSRRVEVCLIASTFCEHHGRDLATALRDSFPWVRIVFVSDDDANASVDGAEAAWAEAAAL